MGATAQSDKPWVMPVPPAGFQWHRPDGWTKNKLPAGYRPFLLGETGDGEVLSENDSNGGYDWIPLPEFSSTTGARSDQNHTRTNRPLPNRRQRLRWVKVGTHSGELVYVRPTKTWAKSLKSLAVVDIKRRDGVWEGNLQGGPHFRAPSLSFVAMTAETAETCNLCYINL